MTSDSTAGAHGLANQGGTAVVEVLCKRPFGIDVRSTGRHVFVDGIWRFDARYGIPTRYELNPGAHAIRVWDRKGNTNSNEIMLEFGAVATRSLTCKRIRFPGGLSGQLRLVNNAVRSGGVIVEGLLLEEVETGPFRVL